MNSALIYKYCLDETRLGHVQTAQVTGHLTDESPALLRCRHNFCYVPLTKCYHILKAYWKLDQDTCPNFGLQWKTTKQRQDIGSSVARSNGQQFSFENNWRLVRGYVTYCFSISVIRSWDCIMMQMNIATRCMDPCNPNKACQQLASLCQRSETQILQTQSYQAAFNRCCQHLNNKTLNFTSSITCHVRPSQLNSFRFSFCMNNKEWWLQSVTS